MGVKGKCGRNTGWLRIDDKRMGKMVGCLIHGFVSLIAHSRDCMSTPKAATDAPPHLRKAATDSALHSPERRNKLPPNQSKNSNKISFLSIQSSNSMTSALRSCRSCGKVDLLFQRLVTEWRLMDQLARALLLLVFLLLD